MSLKDLRRKKWKGGKRREKDKQTVKGTLAMRLLVTVTTAELKPP